MLYPTELRARLFDLIEILRIILGNAKSRRNSDRAGFTGQGTAADYRGRSYDFLLEVAGL